jgi:protein gp37
VVEREFANEDDALVYAILKQRARRNLTKAEIIRYVRELDKRKYKTRAESKKKANKNKGLGRIPPIGGIGRNSSESLEKSSEEEEPKGPSAANTAKVLGISPRQVERYRTIQEKGSPELIKALERNEISVNAAYKEVMKQEREEKAKVAEKEGKAKFNAIEDRVEWVQWSWNPVTGCKHGCAYCYAHDLANKIYENKFRPTFHEDRLSAPKNTRAPTYDKDNIGNRNVLVCSMADLFGEWVPDEWIHRVLESVTLNPQWNFIFLTKNPSRYLKLKDRFPKNCWLGATVDTQDRVGPTLKVFKKLREKDNGLILFIAFEPLLEKIKIPFEDKIIDWIIIGARSKVASKAEFQPNWEWVESLFQLARENKCDVYFKSNLLSRPREFPDKIRISG